jgi:iron complex transport system ATP-binding protein
VPEAALIDIHNATLWRDDTLVFENLNLTIPQHQRVAILGPNGSGKTTLLKTINRELYPVAKEDSWIRILGRDRWNVWELRERIGVVSHDLHSRYTPTTTALAVVASGFQSSIGIHGILADSVSKEQLLTAQAILADLGMEKFQQTELRAMSTGEQRRCLLARALVHNPDTLILDEPTTGLDISGSFDYMRQISRLAQAGQNIVIVTHHLNEIPAEVERVIMLKHGSIVADGSKEETLTGAFLSDIYETRVRVSQVDGHFLAYPG